MMDYNVDVRCYREKFKSITIIMVLNVMHKLIRLAESKLKFSVCRYISLKC